MKLIKKMIKQKEINNINFGVIGVGRWGPNVIGAINKINDATLINVADKNDEALSILDTRFPNIGTTQFPSEIIKNKKLMQLPSVHQLKLTQI